MIYDGKAKSAKRFQLDVPLIKRAHKLVPCYFFLLLASTVFHPPLEKTIDPQRGFRRSFTPTLKQTEQKGNVFRLSIPLTRTLNYA